MPDTYLGNTTDQKVVTVANNDSAINAELAAQKPDGWLASLFTVSGSDVIILFTRTFVTTAAS